MIIRAFWGIGVVALVLAVGMTGPASAQQTGGVQIQGNTNITATAKNINSNAENNSVSDVGVGRINGNTKIQGNTNINANAENITSTAKNNSKSCVDVGTIGTNACESSK